MERHEARICSASECSGFGEPEGEMKVETVGPVHGNLEG